MKYKVLLLPPQARMEAMSCMHRYFNAVAVVDCFVVDKGVLEAYKRLLGELLLLGGPTPHAC